MSRELPGGVVIRRARRSVRRSALPKREHVLSVVLAGLLVTSVLSSATVGAFASNTRDRPVARSNAPLGGGPAAGSTAADAGVGAPKCEADQFTAPGDEPNPLSLKGEVSAHDSSTNCAGKRVDFAYVETLVVKFEESTERADPEDDLNLFLTLDGRAASSSTYDRRLLDDDADDVETLVLTREELPLQGQLGIAVRAYSGKSEFAVNFEYEMMEPRAKFDYSPLKDGEGVRPDERVRLDASGSIVPNATIMPGNGTYEWTVRRDGRVVRRLSGEEAITQFRNGTYDVTLTVTGPKGYSATTNRTIGVSGPPVPDLVPETAVYDSDGKPHYVREEGITLYGGGSVCNEGTIAGYEWAFPNGSTATGEAREYAFEKPEGTKNVELTVECTVYDYLRHGGETVTNSTTREVEVKMPPIKIYKVEQTTPAWALVADIMRCDNVGNVNAYVVGEQAVANVSFTVGDRTTGGDRASSFENTVYQADTAKLMPGKIPTKRSRSGDNTVTVRVEGADGATDEVSYRLKRAPIPELIEFGLKLGTDPGNPSDAVVAIPKERRKKRRHCSAEFFIEVVGSESNDGSSDGNSGFNPGSVLPAGYTLSSSRLQKKASAAKSLGGKVSGMMDIGPLLSPDLANAPFGIKEMQLLAGLRVRYKPHVLNDANGQIGVGGIVIGGIEMGGGIESQIHVRGALLFLFNIRQSLTKLDFAEWRATLEIVGRIDLTSFFSGPFPISIDPPIVGGITIDPPLEVWLVAGPAARITRGEDTNPSAVGLSDLNWELRGSPALRLSAELGYDEDDLPCGSCSLEFRLGGGLHTNWIEVAPNALEDGPKIKVKGFMVAQACWHLCLDWKKYWTFYDTGGRLRSAGATTLTGRALSVPTRGNYGVVRSETTGPTVETEVRSGQSPARALLGSNDRGTVEADIDDALRAA